MALIYIDGFDQYNGFETMTDSPFWYYVNGVSTSSTTRYGIGSSVNYNSAGETLSGQFGNESTIVAGVAFFMEFRRDYPLFRFASDSSGTQCSLFLNASYNLEIRSGESTVIDTGSTVIGALNWYYVECKVVVGTSGSMQVWLNGVDDFGGSVSVNTDPIGSGYINRITMSSIGANTWYDDFYLDDSTRHDQPRVVTLLPDNDSTPMDWDEDGTGDDGNRYNEINQLAYNDSSYIKSATIGDQSKFTYTALPSTIGTWNIIGVQPMARCKNAVGGTSTLKLSTVAGGGTQSDTGLTTGAGSFTYVYGVHETKNGSDPYTGTDIDGMTVQYEYES